MYNSLYIHIIDWFFKLIFHIDYYLVICIKPVVLFLVTSLTLDRQKEVALRTLFCLRCPGPMKARFKRFIAVVCSAQGVRSVSYTHLDVYKRQVIYFSSVLMSAI